MKMEINKEKRNKIIFWLLLLAGAVLRFAGLGILPDGKALNPDEAYAGYEAWSLLHYGMDSHGYSMPVYLVAWGSGMNALQTYLMIPFVAVFGLTPFAIRLPQAIAGTFSILAFYGLMKENQSEEKALVGMGILAIMPWHLMLSRFGLESNLLPAFLLFGMYFMVVGVRKPKCYMLAGLFWGLSLYCYASVWAVMPLLIFDYALAIIIYQKGKVTKYFGAGLLIMVILAIPLVLFCMVNYLGVQEFKLGFLSIPKLAAVRSVEIKTHTWEWKKAILDTINTFLRMDDGNPWNATSRFGLYYPGWLGLAILGIIVMMFRVIKDWKKQLVDVLFLIQGFASCVLATIYPVNFNRVNMIHIPIIYCIVQAICYLTDDLWKCQVLTKIRHISVGRSILIAIVCCFYSVNFVLFMKYYMGEYNDLWKRMYHSGFNEAVSFANSQKAEEGTIFVMDVLYPKLLFSAQYPTNQFVDTVVYRDEAAEFLDPQSFSGYHMGDFDMGIQEPGDVMLCGTWNDNMTYYLNYLGYEQHVFEDYTVYIVQ